MAGDNSNPSVAAQASAPPLPPDLAAKFPPGANLETYRIESVTGLLERAAYFPLFSVPRPDQPNRPILSDGDPPNMIGVEVNEQLHRFAIDVARRCSTGAMRSRNTVGEPVASVHIRWMVMPDDFEAGPGRPPPPTPLDPTRSQRFCLLDGALTFQGRKGTGFHAFGTGRTFPVLVGGQPQLRIGAVIDILEGLGQFRGLSGTVCVNGYITPPQGLALNLMLRIMDPKGGLYTRAALAPLRPVPDADPSATFFVFLGEVDADRPTQLIVGPGGEILGSHVFELLRVVDLRFVLDESKGLRARADVGGIAGCLEATLRFNPLDPNPISPIQTQNGVFAFWGPGRSVRGTIRANMVEGRAFRTPLAGAPLPVYRFGGFGPILGGTGCFQGADGMMSINAAVSVFPRTLSNLYVLRLNDPDGRMRARTRDAET